MGWNGLNKLNASELTTSIDASQLSRERIGVSQKLVKIVCHISVTVSVTVKAKIHRTEILRRTAVRYPANGKYIKELQLLWRNVLEPVEWKGLQGQSLVSFYPAQSGGRLYTGTKDSPWPTIIIRINVQRISGGMLQMH